MKRSRLFVVIVLALVGHTVWTVHEVIHGPLQSVVAQLSI